MGIFLKNRHPLLRARNNSGTVLCNTILYDTIHGVKDVIQKFDKFLLKKNLKFEAVIVGGAAIILLNLTDRKTKDIDCLDPQISSEIYQASLDFLEAVETDLRPNWLNNGPEDLKSTLPKNWEMRIQKIFEGKSITFYTLGRMDLLKTKLFAFCDREIDFEDCLKLRPSAIELDQCFEWVTAQDGNPLWPKRVEEMFHLLKKALNDE